MNKQNIYPIKLRENRVWRTYKGGKLLDKLQQKEVPQDSHFPEEWIMSVVRARNTGREDILDEGLGKLETPIQEKKYLQDLIESNSSDLLGVNHVNHIGKNMGVLVKLIDSSERLAVQVHPNREMAGKLFDSAYGKTECWHILGGRTIDGEPPHVYLGFKPGVTRQKWKALFKSQDIEGMLDCLHKFYVQPGETYLIEGGIPHAIGAGCFMVEIQEPTDLTIRTERVSPSGFKIDDLMCHQGIGFETMFDCFRYESYTRDETLNKFKVESKMIMQSPGYEVLELIGYDSSPYFSMRLLEVEDELEITSSGVFSGLYGLSGSAMIKVSEKEQMINEAEQYFIPAKVKTIKIENRSFNPVKILQFFGPNLE